jgi:hypothetical protein
VSGKEVKAEEMPVSCGRRKCKFFSSKKIRE